MKKMFLTLSILGCFCVKAQAVGVNSIDSMVNGASVLQQDVSRLINFLVSVQSLNNSGFQISIAGSTQTVTLNNAMKNGLLGEYRNHLIRLQADLDAMPQ